MAINPCLLYILQSDWSLLLLVNTHGSFHCKQGMLLVNIQSSCYCQHVETSPLRCKIAMLFLNTLEVRKCPTTQLSKTTATACVMANFILSPSIESFTHKQCPDSLVVILDVKAQQSPCKRWQSLLRL